MRIGSTDVVLWDKQLKMALLRDDVSDEKPQCRCSFCFFPCREGVWEYRKIDKNGRELYCPGAYCGDSCAECGLGFPFTKATMGARY